MMGASDTIRVHTGEGGTPDRDKAGLFAPRGSRFDRMLRLADRDASDEEFLAAIPEIDEATIGLCRKIVRGETTNMGGEAYAKGPPVKPGARPRRSDSEPTSRDRQCARLRRAGMSISKIACRTGLSRAGVRGAIRRCERWEDLQGSGEHAGNCGSEDA